MPLVNTAVNDYDTLRLPLNTEHAVSLHNLNHGYQFDDKSPTLSASIVLDNPDHMHFMPSPVARNPNFLTSIARSTMHFKKIRSSSETLARCFHQQMSISGEAINDVNIHDIGWKIPDPFAALRSKAKLLALRTRKNVPVSLKAIKESIPVHSRSTTSIPYRHSFDEQVYRASHIMPPPCKIKIDREKIRKAILKSRSFESKGDLLQQSHRDDMLADNSREKRGSDGNIQKKRPFEKNSKKSTHKLSKPRSLPSVNNILLKPKINFLKLDNSPGAKSITPDIQSRPLIKQNSKFYSGYELGPKPINETPFMNAKEKIRRFHKSGGHPSGRNTPKFKINEGNQKNECGDDCVFQFPTSAKSPSQNRQGRSSSLKDLSSGEIETKETNTIEHGSSTVEINEMSEKIKLLNKSNACSSRSNPSIANRALNSPSQNIPNHQKCDLLQKPSSSNENDVPSNSSEYDVRDPRSGASGMNSRGAGGQQSLSGGCNSREPSRSLSDRDAREGDSFNRSLSTTEGTPDDKIGKLESVQLSIILSENNKMIFCLISIDGSLSDTAVGLGQGLDRSRRNQQQRSPKSETPTRERDRFGTGMGKKSNSTSQLSATGKLISPHS